LRWIIFDVFSELCKLCGLNAAQNVALQCEGARMKPRAARDKRSAFAYSA
jgi:hypothetical protein